MYRAQAGHGWRTEPCFDLSGVEVMSFTVQAAYPADRMYPLQDRATEGRVNAKGVPCLYCSDNKNTAMTETRAWIGAFVTLAEVVLTQNVKLVDCTADSMPGYTLACIQHGPSEREGCVWASINRAFSEPVLRSDDVAEYAPTQVLAEAFRIAGFDGIIYGSNFDAGKNIALFEPQIAAIGHRYLCRVQSVHLEFTNLESAQESGPLIGDEEIPY